ncbi:hypothetical protein PR048_011224 [Dryococelus australis]|uniref:Uncharacterized protein n=1 Tax=Dryococelus australis TaxID=614101 RepID=A0ABQ9HKY9_9NEOP|nr:hypothetical protein PR048_011224 [Dryococelus australis]
MSGFNKKNTMGIMYPNLPSAFGPIPHGREIRVSTLPTELQDADSSSPEYETEDDVDFAPDEHTAPQVFT